MKIVVEIDPGRQEFATPGCTDVEAIIRRRLAGAPDGRIQVQGFIATIVGVVDEKYDALVPYIAPPLEGS